MARKWNLKLPGKCVPKPELGNENKLHVLKTAGIEIAQEDLPYIVCPDSCITVSMPSIFRNVDKLC
jgi:hypothetical protein